MCAKRFTQAQILCGLRIFWRETVGGNDLFDAGTRIDHHLGADGIWNEIDISDVLCEIEQFFRFSCPPEEWQSYFGWDTKDPEEWERKYASQFTFGRLADFIREQVEGISLEPLTLLGKPCLTAGIFRGLERLTEQIHPTARRVAPSTPIRASLRGLRLQRFWNHLRWIMEDRIPASRRIKLGCGSFYFKIGIGLFIAVWKGDLDGLWLSLMFTALLLLPTAFLIEFLNSRLNPLPKEIETFGDLSRATSPPSPQTNDREDMMFEALKKLKYGARVLLSRKGGDPEMIDVRGRPVSILSGGDGPPFVYLHSTLGESAHWLPFHAAWAKHFTVYAPLHPGFGKSGGFEQIDSIEDMAFHYVELFDALGLGEVILGGVSLGGWIAAEFAVRWPERVKKLWIADAPGLWVEEQPLPDLFRDMEHLERLRALLFHDADGYMAKMILPDNPDDERRLAGYQAMTVLARLMWQRPYDAKLSERLHRITCPTLLLWGAHDRLVPPAYGEAYRQYLPQAELKLIPDCGHMGMFEKEAEFVEAVMKFCK